MIIFNDWRIFFKERTVFNYSKRKNVWVFHANFSFFLANITNDFLSFSCTIYCTNLNINTFSCINLWTKNLSIFFFLISLPHTFMSKFWLCLVIYKLVLRDHSSLPVSGQYSVVTPCSSDSELFVLLRSEKSKDS